MNCVLAGGLAGLLQGARLAAEGEAVRVLRMGSLAGIAAWRVTDLRNLEALRGRIGPVGWVPKHAEHWRAVGGALTRCILSLDEDAARWVLPARGLEACEARAERSIRDAGGDVVDVLVEAIELEDDRVVGVITDCGFEWVDTLWTDVAGHVLDSPAAAPRVAEVELVGDSALPWVTEWDAGPISRVVRDPIDPRRHRVCLRAAEQPRRVALAAIEGRIAVESTGRIRLGPELDGGDQSFGAWSQRGVRFVGA